MKTAEKIAQRPLRPKGVYGNRDGLNRTIFPLHLIQKVLFASYAEKKSAKMAKNCMACCSIDRILKSLKSRFGLTVSDGAIAPSSTVRTRFQKFQKRSIAANHNF